MNFQLKKPSAVLKRLCSFGEYRESEENNVPEPQELSLQKDKKNDSDT